MSARAKSHVIRRAARPARIDDGPERSERPRGGTILEPQLEDHFESTIEHDHESARADWLRRKLHLLSSGNDDLVGSESVIRSCDELVGGRRFE